MFKVNVTNNQGMFENVFHRVCTCSEVKLKCTSPAQTNSVLLILRSVEQEKNGYTYVMGVLSWIHRLIFDFAFCYINFSTFDHNFSNNF